MRAFVVFVALSIVLAGCATLGGPRCVRPHAGPADCSYGLSGVSAISWFLDESWDRERVLAAFTALGFEAGPSTGTVVASPFTPQAGAQTLRVSQLTNGSIELTLEFYVGSGLGYTHSEADAMANETRDANAARAEAVLAGFERATNWTRDTPIAWQNVVYVT